jgi:preprotein translocase subunit YajC
MAAAAVGSDWTTYIVVYAAIIGVFYFLWIRPQQAQRKKMAALQGGLSVGDRVMTAGGMLGVVSSIDDDAVGVEIADGVIVQFTRRGIIERIVDEAHTPDEASTSDE